MPEETNDKDFRASVLQQLRETLNQQRKLDSDNESDGTDAEPQGEEVTCEPPPPHQASLRQVGSLDTERRRLNNVDFEAEINLKKSYGKWFLIILACQLLIMNGVFIAVGLDKLSFKDNLTLQLYMGGTMTEVFGLVLVVTKYLFKRR
ncbi:hypothetical protein [Serratia marcescens]|uniref:hypothetical protein n=1 Tax=Serratia marcescens TaxID=615 RepID=UPI0020A40739|nr:hypothetical protein [Serratia marcescens]